MMDLRKTKSSMRFWTSLQSLNYMHSSNQILFLTALKAEDELETMKKKINVKENKNFVIESLNKEIILLKEELNVDIHELGFNGNNCFLAAVLGDKRDTMKYLNSIDENLRKEKDKDGRTALDLARKFAKPKTVDLLNRAPSVSVSLSSSVSTIVN